MKDHSTPCCEPEFWAYFITCFVLVSLAGITSGLALGLLSFSKVELEVFIKAGEPRAQKNAAKILPLVKNEHLLLCTLLIVKTLAVEALPIFLDAMLPIWAAIVMSVILVVAFGEIIPQAICARYGLSLGAQSSALVRFLLVVLYPLAYPISQLLDWLLGKGHSALLRRAELKTLVDLHSNKAGKGGELSHHETTIISGALDLTQKTAKDAMTPISETFSLDVNSKLDMRTMSLILSKGHSHIPIYSRSPTNVIGLILVKNLIFCRPEDEVPIKYVTVRKIPRVHEDWPLYDILNQFQKGHSHMAVVVKKSKQDMENTVNNSEGKPEVLDIVINKNSNSSQEENQEFQGPRHEGVTEQDKDLHPQYDNGEKGAGIVSHEDLESIPSNKDEEVIGIITMEDVMEELLQEEILDETDEHVNVQNKIRINPLPLRRSASASISRSFGRASISRLPSIKQQPPPLSLHSPILGSQISPNMWLPLTKPTSSASPEKSVGVS